MRAVAYARYSTENQRDASIEDQVRTCRAEVDRQGWQFLRSYCDRAISGASTLRAGYQKLLEDARARSFEVVIAEALDRLSRDQADIANLYKHLSFLGVRLVTVAEGEISELHVGLKGTMNALFLKDLAQKTRRGLEGRVRQGRSGGGISYGYDLVPGDVGMRRINPGEAEVIQRIFREYAGGKSPRAIARQLNKERVSGPHGREWRDTTIRGHIIRGTGILSNQLYIGRLLWNRLRYLKDPISGRRRSRLNSENEWVTEAVPDLRIVDDQLWNAVKQRQGDIRQSERVQRARETRFWENRRARHLLTGLAHCGFCGGTLASIGRDYLACSAARGKGSCNSRQSVRRHILEDLVLGSLRDRLMAPELVKEFTTAFHEELNRERRQGDASRSIKQQELAKIARRLGGLIDAIAEGLRAPDLQTRLDELQARKVELEAELVAPPDAPIRLHPKIGEVYGRKIANLRAALDVPADRDEAIEILRSIIQRIDVRPVEGRYEVEIIGEIARMIEIGRGYPDTKGAARDEGAARSVKVVAGIGFEPMTFRL
jgi:site-specific DNA recombinase